MFGLCPTQTFSDVGGTGTLSVTAVNNAQWSASSSQPWIQLSPTSPASGSATLTYTIASNANNPNSRQASISVAGYSYTITQQGLAIITSGFYYSVPYTGGGGNGPVVVQGPANWSFTCCSVAWLHVTQTTNGVSFSADANNDPNPRNGTFTVAGQTITVSENGKPPVFGVNPSSLTGGVVPGSVTQFNAVINGQQNSSYNSQVVWRANNGSISATGLYTAPSAANASDVVYATYTPPGQSPITVQVNVNTLSLPPFNNSIFIEPFNGSGQVTFFELIAPYTNGVYNNNRFFPLEVIFTQNDPNANPQNSCHIKLRPSSNQIPALMSDYETVESDVYSHPQWASNSQCKLDLSRSSGH